MRGPESYKYDAITEKSLGKDVTNNAWSSKEFFIKPEYWLFTMHLSTVTYYIHKAL